MYIHAGKVKTKIENFKEYHFPKRWVKRFSVHLREILSSLGGYLKAQAIALKNYLYASNGATAQNMPKNLTISSCDTKQLFCNTELHIESKHL